MTHVQLRTRWEQVSRRRRRPSYGFAVAIAVIVLFGIVLAIILWLSSGPDRSSNDPNRTPNHSAQYQQLGIRSQSLA
ncbi:MAG: hypothetical protein J2P17_26190 [Mycobacterium sp.]|nr:hypothetical protein [Mycobacterium sp.]